mgnify:FL=1
MNKIFKLIKATLSFVSGYFLLPMIMLGFILATNSSKGWQINNEDGLVLIPLGIVFLIIAFAIAFTCVFCSVSAIRKKSHESYLFIGLHLLGIIAYLINWWLIDK